MQVARAEECEGERRKCGEEKCPLDGNEHERHPRRSEHEEFAQRDCDFFQDSELIHVVPLIGGHFVGERIKRCAGENMHDAVVGTGDKDAECRGDERLCNPAEGIENTAPPHDRLFLERGINDSAQRKLDDDCHGGDECGYDADGKIVALKYLEDKDRPDDKPHDAFGAVRYITEECP